MGKTRHLRAHLSHCNPSGGPRPAPLTRFLRGLLEHEPEVIEQLALEADAVRADARGEGEPEVLARQVLRHELRLEQGLLEARLGEPLSPLLDRLDGVEPPARGLYQAEMRLGSLLDLLHAEREERAGEL